VMSGQIATHHMAGIRERAFLARMLEGWLARIGLPASTVVVFAALAFTERLRWPSVSIPRGLTVVVLATAAEVAAASVLGRYIWRVRTWIGIAAVCAAGAAVLVRFRGQPSFGAGLALAALASVILAASVSRQALFVALRISAARWQRIHAETGVLSALVGLLGRLNVPKLRRDAGSRGPGRRSPTR